MKKLNYSDVKHQQLVDLRTQHAYQAGHVKNSINLNPGNFEKYAAAILSFNHPVVLITNQEIEESIDEIEKLTNTVNEYLSVEGYINIDQFPKENLSTVGTTPAEDFLESDADYILLDVRHPDEITRIAPKKNLLNIPFENLPESLEYLNKAKEIYTLCGSGNRSTAAASYLIKEGYKPTVIEGGMKAIEEIQNK